MSRTPARSAIPRLRLWAEFLTLYVGGPLVLALLLPPRMMFTALGAMTFVGILLLHLTPGFRWRSLALGWRRLSLWSVLVFSVATAVVAGAATWWLFPGRLFSLPLAAPSLWLTIMLAYPLVSALPQEVLFRALFFRRYGSLFPAPALAVPLNAALFAFAHLMYGHPLVFAMTFFGGLAFAWAYAVKGSFPGAVLLHALGGQIVFTSGLGILFYSGAVG